MCLIVIAHASSARYPLVIAANRDEEYARPSLAAGFWDEGGIIGGRDAVHGGSWLAMTRSGRFAAVTNLRGATRSPQLRSRGELVTDFVRSDAKPREYAADVMTRLENYAGFHLLIGVSGRDLVQISGDVTTLAAGIHGLSNAPAGVRWPKVEMASGAMPGVLELPTADAVAEALMRLLRTAPANDVTRDLFIRGELYGTRASTVIVATAADVLFIEQSYGPGGAPAGSRTAHEFPLIAHR